MIEALERRVVAKVSWRLLPYLFLLYIVAYIDRINISVAALQMPLSQVLALQLNDILMVRLLERTEVRINQQKLFRGSIFEDDGSLFLTSLESVKNP